MSIKREQRKHTDEECELFQKACLCYGAKWREYQLSVTPKVHQIESHVVKFMWDFRRIFGEDSIERRHNTNNHYNRVLSCVNRWYDKLILREKRINVEIFNKGVAESCLFAVEATKRNLTEQQKSKKRAKTIESDKIKHENRSSAISNFNLNN